MGWPDHSGWRVVDGAHLPRYRASVGVTVRRPAARIRLVGSGALDGYVGLACSAIISLLAQGSARRAR